MGLNEEIWPGERVRYDLNMIMWRLFILAHGWDAGRIGLLAAVDALEIQ